jgi:redox-sensitive bicupin YhaK (pirin superfamily)
MDDEQIPKLKKEASTVRVLLGEVEGVRSTIQEPSGTMLAQASVQGRLELVVPDGVDAFALVLRGEGRLAGQRAELHDATSLTAGPLAIEGDGLEVLIGWSARMPRMPAFRGPFCMFNEKHLADAARRFQAGEMGALTPSPVSWSR